MRAHRQDLLSGDLEGRGIFQWIGQRNAVHPIASLPVEVVDHRRGEGEIVDGRLRRTLDTKEHERVSRALIERRHRRVKRGAHPGDHVQLVCGSHQRLWSKQIRVAGAETDDPRHAPIVGRDEAREQAALARNR